MGWASGFAAGTRLGEAILKGQQRRAYEGIQSQKAEGLQGYTAEDAAKLEELAKSGLYDIVPQYGEPTPQQRDPNLMNPVELERNMTQDPRGEFIGYRAVPKAEIAARAQDPQNRQYSGIAPRDINPSRVTDYLGQRYAGDLPEARQVGLRSRALAEVTVDPMERQRLISAAIDEERKAVLAQREDELFPLQKRERELGIASTEAGLTESGYRLRALQDAEDLAKGKKQARADLSDWRNKNPGKQPTLDVLQQYADKNNVPITDFLTEQDAKNTFEYKELKSAFSKAATGGVTGMNKFLASRFDPDTTDNITPQVIQDPRTKKFVVKYGDAILPEYGAHGSFQELLGTVQGRIDKDPLGTLKTLADIEASKAATAASKARTVYTQGLANQLGRVQKDNLQVLSDSAGNLKVVDVSRLKPDESGEVVFPKGFKPYKPKAFDPKEYSEVIKNYVTAGFSQADAEIKADEIFGRSKLGDEIDYGAFANQKAAKGKGGLVPPPVAGAADAPPAPPAPVAAPTGMSSFAQNRQQQQQQPQGLASQARARVLAVQQAREILSKDETYNQLQAARTQAVQNNNRTLASRIDAKIQEIEGAVAQRFMVR